MLEETGVAYEAEIFGFGSPMRTKSFLGRNPMGKVPVLLHGDIVVTECAAICTYLADRFPKAGLMPEDAAGRAAFYRWMFFAAGPVEQALTNGALGVEVPDEKQGMAGYGSKQRTLRSLESHLKKHDHMAGKAFSAADVYCGSQIAFGIRFGGIERNQIFDAYVERITNRPAAIRAAEIDDRLAAEMTKAKAEQQV